MMHWTRDRATSLGEDLLRWAGLVDDDGNEIASIDAIQGFADAVENSSIPEACRVIVNGE